MKWMLFSVFLIFILLELSCYEKQSEYIIGRTSYDKDLDLLYRKNLISKLDYLTYLHMGPQGLFVNADKTGVTLENLILTGYKPDSMRYQTEKIKDSIHLEIEETKLSDSLVIITMLVSNRSNKTIAIKNFEIADILGSEVANIWYYESIDSTSFKPGSTSKLKDHYLPVVNDFFKDLYLNEDFIKPMDLYKYIKHIVWDFNYQIIEE